jgi:hypothetical protein
MLSAKLGVLPYEKNRLGVFENRVMRRIFGQKGLMRSFMICTPHCILLG